MKKTLPVLIALLLVVPALTACAPETVVLYTDLGKADVDALIAPFVESSGLKVQIVTFANADTLVNAVTPRRGRNGYDSDDDAAPSPTPNPNPPDVILTQDVMAMTALSGQEAMESYMPPSVASLPLPYGANGGGYWYGFGGKGWVLAWNTALVRKAPESYADLADDDYPLKAVTIPNPQQYFFYPLSIYSRMGADYAMNIFQTLLLNDADFTATPASAIGSVAAGNAQIAVTTLALAKQKKQDGAPVDFAFPDQGQTDVGAYVEFYCAGIAKGGKFPKGAKKLDDWLLSAEAEKRSVEIGLSDVTLRDVGSEAPVVKPLAVSPEEVLASSQAASDAFGRLNRRN